MRHPQTPVPVGSLVMNTNRILSHTQTPKPSILRFFHLLLYFYMHFRVNSRKRVGNVRKRGGGGGGGGKGRERDRAHAIATTSFASTRCCFIGKHDGIVWSPADLNFSFQPHEGEEYKMRYMRPLPPLLLPNRHWCIMEVKRAWVYHSLH